MALDETVLEIKLEADEDVVTAEEELNVVAVEYLDTEGLVDVTLDVLDMLLDEVTTLLVLET